MPMNALRPAQIIVLPARGPASAEPGPRMVTTWDLKCYHCGFVAGQLVAEPDGTGTRRVLRISPGCPSPVHVEGGRLRCCRCGGPLFADEVETAFYHPIPGEAQRSRRGRKPRSVAGA